MNIYEEQHLEQKLDEITNQIGHLLLDIILVSVKQVSREYQSYEDIEESIGSVPCFCSTLTARISS